MKLADWFVLAGSIAALLTFWIMQTTARRQLRAYVGVNERASPPERHLIMQADGSIKAIAVAKNFGQTPAYNVVSKSHIGYADYPLPQNFQFPELEYGPGGPLFPGDELTIDVRGKPEHGGAPLPPAVWMSTLKPFKSPKTWYVYGFVTYQDIYGARRFSRYCFAIWWNDGPGNIPGWYFGSRFNDTDGISHTWWRRMLRFLIP